MFNFALSFLMKKLLVIPLMFIYLFAVSGMLISVHYCGQQVESWSVFSVKESCSDGACGDESNKPDDCCKDEVVTAKVSHDQNFVTAFKFKSQTDDAFAVLPQHPFVSGCTVQATQAVTANANLPNAPPGLWQQIPLYRLHSSFTYYG